jgi:pyridoxal 5'-phosphate synthase pdxS subunit
MLAPWRQFCAQIKNLASRQDPDVIAKVSRGLGEALVGTNVEEIPEPHGLAELGR